MIMNVRVQLVDMTLKSYIFYTRKL